MQGSSSLQTHDFFCFVCKNRTFAVLKMRSYRTWLHLSEGCRVLLSLWLCCRDTLLPWEGEGSQGSAGPQTRLPSLSTVCIFQESNAASNLLCKMTAEQLSGSFLCTELITSDTYVTAECSLLGDWFKSLALHITWISKVKRLSAQGPCHSLHLAGKLKLALN